MSSGGDEPKRRGRGGGLEPPRVKAGSNSSNTCRRRAARDGASGGGSASAAARRRLRACVVGRGHALRIGGVSGRGDWLGAAWPASRGRGGAWRRHSAAPVTDGSRAQPCLYFSLILSVPTLSRIWPSLEIRDFLNFFLDKCLIAWMGCCWSNLGGGSCPSHCPMLPLAIPCIGCL